MEEFYDIRLGMYVKRKQYLENKLERDIDVISARVRFILAILDDEIILKGKDEEQLEEELETLGYPKFTKGSLEFNPKDENPNPSYDYLVSMPIRSMTKKRVEDLQKQLEDKNMLYDVLKKKSVNELWLEDLDNLETLYQKELDKYEKEMNSAEKVQGKKKKIIRKKK
jgi:DNA topoisomerase-2